MSSIDRFMEVYRTLSADNLHLLDEVYAENIIFIDPAHEISGLAELQRYFKALYENISTIAFDFEQVCQSDDTACILWQMKFSHPRVAGNQEISVPGISYLKFTSDGKVSFHRDYFDLGAMLYEHLPVIGFILKSIKKKLGK